MTVLTMMWMFYPFLLSRPIVRLVTFGNFIYGGSKRPCYDVILLLISRRTEVCSRSTVVFLSVGVTGSNGGEDLFYILDHPPIKGLRT